jgi:hypothetical protein
MFPEEFHLRYLDDGRWTHLRAARYGGQAMDDRNMVFHIVLFRPKPAISETDRQAMLDALSAAARGIPSVKRFHIGKRITHGRPYEQLMKEDLPYAAVIEFDGEAGLKAYLEHPAHDALGAKFMELLEAGLIYDYEMKPLR